MVAPGQAPRQTVRWMSNWLFTIFPVFFDAVFHSAVEGDARPGDKGNQ